MFSGGYAHLLLSKNVRVREIMTAEVDRCHFTTFSTSSHAANFERTELLNRSNFVHEVMDRCGRCIRVCTCARGSTSWPRSELGAPSSCRMVTHALILTESAGDSFCS